MIFKVILEKKQQLVEEKDADNVRKVLCKVFIQCYKGNKGRCKESTIRGHRKKSDPQMGFELTTLRVLDRML